MNKYLSLLLIGSVLAMPALKSTAQGISKDSISFSAEDMSLDPDHDILLIDSIEDNWVAKVAPFPNYFFMPAVYDHYKYRHPLTIHQPAEVITSVDITRLAPKPDSLPWFDWITEANNTARVASEIEYNYFYNYPELVRYNMATLPEPPKMYRTYIDPRTLQFDIREFVPQPVADADIQEVEIAKRHWIHSFNASLQFSQAYVSPNWYQGGNNNLNVIGQVIWNVKLNQKYHPKLLFEATTQYKVGVYSAPDDSIHQYSISEDIFQFNSTFGLKASKKWYYSVTAQFKTQLLNSYAKNSNNLRSSFLSPGELNVGIGMTYNTANAKKTFSFDASISPLSYNLRTCINNRINETAYNIEAGHNATHKFGSSAECKLRWQIHYNISLQSRLFVFSDYERIYGDWENTLVFEINRFLTTQIYAHMRYDTATPRCADPSWHKFQIKEILSFGFAYKFNT